MMLVPFKSVSIEGDVKLYFLDAKRNSSHLPWHLSFLPLLSINLAISVSYVTGQ